MRRAFDSLKLLFVGIKHVTHLENLNNTSAKRIPEENDQNQAFKREQAY